MNKKELMQTYNKIAENYGLYRRIIWEPIREFLKDKDTVLDIGCGDCPAAKHYKNITFGLDFSLELLKQCTAKNRICADIEQIPIKNNSFKYITSIAVIHHLDNERSRLNFLKEIKRILKPNGTAFITAILKPSPKAKKIDENNYYLPFGKYDRYYHIFTKKELEDLVKKAGLTLDKYTSDKKNHYIKIKKEA